MISCPFSPLWAGALAHFLHPARHDRNEGRRGSSTPIGLLSVGLDQRDLAVEIGFLLRMELEGDAADRSDAFQHRK
jgi:hypothetical protein